MNNTNSVKHQVALLQVQARSIIDEANASMPAERQVHLKSALAVVKRSLNSTRSLAFEVREFHAFRELSSFITLAQKNKSLNAQPKNTDLLPVGHPASTASHAMTASALRNAQIQWVLSDNRISDEAKPLLASAFDAVPDSPEHKYAMTRLSLMKESRVPLEALVAAFGDGNSTAARRARAMLQRRDRKGRFAYQGGGISALIKRINGVVERLTGKTVSNSPDGKTVRVELPDGRLVDVPIDSGEFIKAVINPSADGFSGVPAKYSSSDTVVDEASLQYFDAPHGFEKDTSYTGAGQAFTDDSYNVVKNEDGTFSISQRGTGVDLGTADSWSEVQKKLQSDDENLAKAEGSQPIARLTDQQIDDMYDESKNPLDIKSPYETPEDTTPAKGAPDDFKYSYPDGAYKLSPQQVDWEPEGRDDQESTDYTDDPKVIAGKWKSEGLVARLKMAILPQSEGGNATGYAPLPFNEGLEQVPAEAVYAALDEKGLDAKMEVAKIYDEALGTTENQDALTAAREADKTVVPEATLPEDVTPTEPTKPKKKKEAPLPKPDVEDLPLTVGQKIAWFVEAFSTKGGLLEGFLLTPKPTNQMIYEYVRDTGVPEDELRAALEDAGIEIAPDPEADITSETPEPDTTTPDELVDGAPEPVDAVEPTDEPDVADIVDEISSGDLTDEEIQAMLDGEGIDEGDVPGVFIPSGSLQEIPFDTAKFVLDDPANPDGPGHVEKSSGTSNIIDFAGRKMVIVDVNGVKVPFYLSTGDGGKKNVPAGQWYPFLGVGSDGWINKDGQKMTDYYGSPELKAQAEWLDANIGDVRKDDTIPKVSPTGSHIDAINADLMTPTDNGTADTQKKIDAAVADLVERVKTKDIATPEEVKSKKAVKDIEAVLDGEGISSDLAPGVAPEKQKVDNISTTEQLVGEPNAERASRLNARADELAAAGDTAGAAVYRLRALRDGQAVRLHTSTGEGNVSLPVGNVEAVNTFEPSDEAKSIMQDGGITPLTMHELTPNAENAAIFHQAITDAKNANEHGASVYVYSPEEYAGMRMFVSADGKSGFALKGNDLVSVFKGDTTDKFVAHGMVPLAIQEGATTADAFDTVLPKMYGDHGLKTVARLPWDDSQAPEDWNKETFSESNNGEPDVVFMAYDPDDTAGYTAGQGQTFTEYGDAVNAQSAPVTDVQTPSKILEKVIENFLNSKEVGPNGEPYYAPFEVKSIAKKYKLSPFQVETALKDAGIKSQDEVFKTGKFAPPKPVEAPKVYDAAKYGEPEPLPVAPPNVKNGDISPGGDWVWIGKDSTDPTKDKNDKRAYWRLTPQGEEKKAAGANYGVDTDNTATPQWLQDATPDGWTPKIHRTWDIFKGVKDDAWIQKTLEDGTLIRLDVNADGTYTIKNGFGYPNSAKVPLNDHTHATPASAEEVIKKSINQTRKADRSNLAKVLEENKFDQATIDAVLNSPAEEATKAVLESARYKEMLAEVDANAADAHFAASNTIAYYNGFKKKVAGIASDANKIKDPLAVDESKIELVLPQDKPEVLTPTNTPVAMTEKVGDPVKVTTSVSDLQAGDVLASDFFTVESVYSDAESEDKKPGSVWVTGYYPGHASQKTKLWNPSDSREVFRNVDVPTKGDLPELSKPFAKDYDPQGKVYKDTALDLFVPKDAEARSKYLDAVDQYNAKLAEAMGKWTAPVDAPSHDATATDPSAPHKLSVPASDLQPGDIAFRTEDPGYSGGVLKEPYTNYFVIEEVFTDENTPAGKVNVRGYYPGHVSQVREWNKDTPIEAVRGDKNVPEKGDGPELVLKKQKEYPVDPTTKKMTPETRAEWLKNVEDFHAGAKASADKYSDPVGDYVAGDTSPVSSVATAPQKPGRAPAQPAFQGERLNEIAKEANGDIKKFIELLSQEEIAFFDYETVGDGGFGPDSAPIQLAAHKVKDGKVVDSFDMFINPGKPLGEYYYQVELGDDGKPKKDKDKNLIFILDENGNKILKGNLKTPDGEPVNDEWLAQQPTLEEAHKAFAEWLGEGAILGGQNIAGFDIPILKYQFEKAGLTFNAGGIVDTLPLAQSITKAPPHAKGVNTLEALAARYGIDLTNAHNAAADSLATHGVLFAMLDEVSKTNDADALTHLDPETKFAEYEEKFAAWQANREAFKTWTAAQALKDAEAKIAEGKPVALDDVIKSASVPEVPNPDGIFNAKSDAVNTPDGFPTGPALKDSPEWVKDDNNTTLIEDTIRPVDFKVGDFIPAEFGGFHEILSIEEDPNKKDFFNIATRVVGTDKTYVKNWFKYNKNYSGVRRPNNALDGSEMPVLESPADAPLPMPEAPAKWNSYDIKQNDHGNFYADGITSEDAIKLRTGELQPPSLPFFVPMYGNTDPNSGEGDLYTEQSIAEGGPRKYWGQFGGAGILVRRKNADGNYEYLLARRQGTSSGSGKWAYFGGAHDTADAAKDPESTVLKELGEEAGIDLTGKAAFVHTHDSTGDPDWSYKTLVADVAPDAIGPDDIKTNWEHSESGWFTADQIKDMSSKGLLFGPFADNAEVILNTSSDESNLPATPAPADAVATATPKELGTVFDVSGWKKVGEAGGSTGGAIYEDQNGNTFFVKPPNNVDDTSDPERHARNEALASALYEEAGVKSGRVFLGKDENGNTVLVSPWIDGSTKDFKDKLSDPAVLAKAQEAFAVDAWLMNWDSVGLVYDNMLMVNGDVVRIDPGGSLLYRARGKSKQEQMSDKVEELDSLRSGQNAQAAKVFGSMTDAQLADSAKLVQAITPERINQIVDAAFPDDKDTADFLKQKLTARRQDLIDRFSLSEPIVAPSQPSAVSPSVEKVDSGAPVGIEIPKADTPPATSIPKGKDSPAASSPPPPPPPTPPAAGGSGGPDIHHLDPSGDMVQQIADAIKDGKLVAFKYHDKERLVTPHGTWENPQNGNINFSATDADGIKKNYTLSKIEKSDNAPTTVSETPSAPSAPSAPSTPNIPAPETKPSLISNYPAPESVLEGGVATDVDRGVQADFNALKKNIEELFDGVTVEVSDNKMVVIDNDTAGYVAIIRDGDGNFSEVGTAGGYEMDPYLMDEHYLFADAEEAVMKIVEEQFDVKGTGKKVDQFPDSDETPSNANEVVAMGEAMKNIYGDSNTVTATEDYFRVTTPEGDMVTVINQGDGTFDVVAYGADNPLDAIDIGSYNDLGEATNALHDAMTALKYNNFGDNPIPVSELLTGSDEDNDSPISDIISDALDGTTPEVPSVDEIVSEIKTENGPKAITDPNLIVEALKKNYPDNYTLSNGDLVVRSKNVNGDTYETVVRRNANETFSVYLRETNGATSAVREVHYAANRHSDLAVNNLIARRNATLDKLINPKKWFTQKKAITPEVASTEVPTNSIEQATQDIINPSFPQTGDIMIDGLLKVVEAAANEPGGIQKVLDSLQGMPGISKETYDNLMSIVNTALVKQTAVAPAKGEETKKPHISKDGVTPVKVGDTVRWEKTKDGVVIEVQIGIVEQLKSEQITVNEFGKYVFSDYVKVRVPGKKKLQPRVSSNLDILSSVPDAEAVDGPLDTADLDKPILPPSKTTTSGPSGLKPEPMGPETPKTPETSEAPLGKIYLDPAGDMKAQIQDAIDNQREISFVYSKKERSFIPEAVYTHSGTGNDLVNGIDNGINKKFNLANIEKSADFQPYTPSPEKPKTDVTPDEVKIVDPATVVSGEATLVNPDSVSPLGSFAYFNVDGQEILVPNSLEGVNNFWSNQEKSNKAISDINPGESIVTQNPQGLVLDYELSTVLKKEIVGDNTVLTVVKLKYLLNGDNNTTNHEQRTITLPSNSSLSVLTPKNGGNGGGGTPPEPDPINPSNGPATIQETADILSSVSEGIKNDPSMSGVDTKSIDDAVDAATKFDEANVNSNDEVTYPKYPATPGAPELAEWNQFIQDNYVNEPGMNKMKDVKANSVLVAGNHGNDVIIVSAEEVPGTYGPMMKFKGYDLTNGTEWVKSYGIESTATIKNHKNNIGEDPYAAIPMVTIEETKDFKKKSAKWQNLKKVQTKDLQVGDVYVGKTGVYGYSYQILSVDHSKGRGFGSHAVVRVIAHSPELGGWYAKQHGKIQTTSLGKWNGYNNVKRPKQEWFDAAKKAAGVVDKPVEPKPKSETVVKDGVTTFNSVDELTADAVGKKDFAFFDAFGATTYDSNYGEADVSFKAGASGLLVKDSGGSSSGKNMVPGMVVTDANGNAGILTNTYIGSNHDSSMVDVTWLSGPDAGSTQSKISAYDVTSTEKFINYDEAAKLGVDVNPEIMDKIKAKTAVVAAQKAQAIAEKKAKEEAKAVWEKLKKDNQVKGSGADPVVVEGPIDWSSSEFSDIPDLNSVLGSVQSDTKKASVGVQVLADSDSIEDSKIRIYRVKDKNGNWQTRVRFKLTDWAGVAKAEELLASGVSGTSRINFRRFQKQADGSIQANGSHESSWIDGKGGGNGTTYSIDVTDENNKVIGKVLLHRASKDASSLNYLQSAHSSSYALSYNNEVDIYLPDNATPQQIEQALKAAGVSQARPATKEDIKVLAENKIIALFGDKADGANNFKGALRDKVLQDMKDKYGLDASQIKPEVINNGDITFVMPDDVAAKIAQQTGAAYINHNWTGDSMPSAGQSRAEFLFELLTGDGLRSTVERWAAGLNIKGMSSVTDGYAVGANYIFTSKSNSPSGYFSFDGAKLLRRLDFYANRSDNFGQKKEKDILEEISAGYVYEILFKGTISWADLSKVHVDSKTRDILIDMLNKANIKDFGGKPITEVLGG